MTWIFGVRAHHNIVNNFRQIIIFGHHLISYRTILWYRSHIFPRPPAPPSPGLRGHGDSQTVVLFSPKTPPRHFHCQKVLCDDANIYIRIALQIINTPINRSSSLHQLWVSTRPKREAPSQHHDRGLCHLG